MVRDGEYFAPTIYEVRNVKKRIHLIRVLFLLLIAILFVALAIYCILGTSKEEVQVSSSAVEEPKEDDNIVLAIKEVEPKKMPVLTDEGRQNIENIYESDTKRAFLTFDDGPSANTSVILDTLEQENIKATFFCLGSQVANYPETTKAIYDKGHYIASHGYSHVYSQIYATPQAVLDEYNASVDAIRTAIGKPEYNPHLFRFPGGLAGGKYATIKAQAKELLSQNDVVNVDWSALNGDGETNNLSPEFEMQRLTDTVGQKNSIVVLMHDAQAKSVTKDTLPQIISYLREQGYEFKSFYDIIK